MPREATRRPESARRPKTRPRTRAAVVGGGAQARGRLEGGGNAAAVEFLYDRVFLLLLRFERPLRDLTNWARLGYNIGTDGSIHTGEREIRRSERIS